jgi:predicted small metal-binding protein
MNEMSKFKCSDIGMDCGFKIQAENEEELMNHIGNHAKWAHKMETIPPETLESVKKAIK